MYIVLSKVDYFIHTFFHHMLNVSKWVPSLLMNDTFHNARRRNSAVFIRVCLYVPWKKDTIQVLNCLVGFSIYFGRSEAIFKCISFYHAILLYCSSPQVSDLWRFSARPLFFKRFTIFLTLSAEILKSDATFRSVSSFIRLLNACGPSAGISSRNLGNRREDFFSNCYML